jgi:hypothetical protein
MNEMSVPLTTKAMEAEPVDDLPVVKNVKRPAGST